MIFITISPGNAICRPAGVIFQPLGSNAPLPSCVGPGLTTPAQSASFRQLPASAMADASIISAEVATNNRRFICHPQKSVGQTGSLPGLLDRPHRRSQGKLPVCPTLAPRFSLFLGVATRHESSSENNYVVMNLFVTALYGSRLQRPPLPRPPDRQRHTRSLYIDEKRLAVGAECGARELFVLITRQDVFREIEDLPIPRQASHVLFIVSVFTKDQAAVRTDADVIRHVERSLFVGFVDQFEPALVFALRHVLPDLAESLIAAAG